MGTPTRLLTIEEAAALLRTTPHALHQLRYRSKGPRGFRVGRRILFDERQLLEWVSRHAEGVRK